MQENGYDRVQSPDFALVGYPGAPELPAVYLSYIIPPNAKVESLVVSQTSSVQIPRHFFVYPSQPPVVIGETVPWVPPDTHIYNSDDLFPGEFIKIVGEAFFDGARIVTVAVFPLQYRPASRKLYRVQSVVFDFVLGPAGSSEIRPRMRGIFEQAIYDASLESIIENDYEILVYYQRPFIVDETQLLAPPPHPNLFAPAVIITPSYFFDSFQPYGDWLNDQGIPTKLVSPQTIYQYWSGRDDAERIRNYIKKCYEQGGTYFILGGDDYHVPMRYGITCDVPPSTPSVDDSIPCDMYFSDLTGEWDADNDGFWGEMTQDTADRYPEVFVGRITAYTAEEIGNWVTKALHYEKNPGIMFNNALWVTTHTGQYVGNGSAPTAFPNHFTHVYATDWWADDVLSGFNQGHAVININCHGNIGGFSTKFNAQGQRVADINSYWPQPPSPTIAGLDWLTNLNKYYIGYSISCYCGAFDSLAHKIYFPNGSDTCIADAFVDAYLMNRYNEVGPFGACAYLVNTRNGWTGMSHNLAYQFWDRIMNPWDFVTQHPCISQVGVAEALSKCDETVGWTYVPLRQILYGHNLFGSPCFETWTDTPNEMYVSHPSHVPVGDTTEFTVLVKDREEMLPLHSVKVCLNKPGDIYEVKKTSASGEVTFAIVPQSDGTINVTATRPHNADVNYNQYLPSQTFCRALYYPQMGGCQTSNTNEVLPSRLCITEMTTPASRNTLLRFGVPCEGHILVAVYDATGSHVSTIRKGNFAPGYYQQILNIENLAGGVYFIVIRQDYEKVSKKMLVIR